MKTVFFILFFMAVGFNPDFSAQIKKRKTAHKSQWTEWKEVRNGGSLTVKWKMKVWIAHRSLCQLYSAESIDTRYENDYPVRLDNTAVTLRDDDILIVTGQASSVSADGSVRVNVASIVNKGVE